MSLTLVSTDILIESNTIYVEPEVGTSLNFTTSNFSDDCSLEIDSEDLDPVVVTILKTLAMSAVIGSAIFGNVLVVTSVLRYERLRLLANVFIASLAFTDLLVACLVMPFSASQEIAGRWIFGKLICDTFNANDVLFSTASLLHLCCISVDRYIAITDPFHYDKKMTGSRVAVMLLCVWSASAVISNLPIHLGWYTTDEQQLTACVTQCTFQVNKAYGIISCAISFWTPATIMVFTYMKIYREAMKQEKMIMMVSSVMSSVEQQSIDPPCPGQHSNGLIPKHKRNDCGGSSLDLSHHPNRGVAQQRRKMRREHKAAKTLGIIMGGFLFCWLPFFTWYLTSALCGSACFTPPIIISILFWIGYANSAFNPMIYALFNRDFRHSFKRLLGCHLANNDSSDFRSTTTTIIPRSVTEETSIR